ncbi:hypothetical protein [Polynucleobacter sp. es-MAR-4]|uniref:hypothetical protein n=1 Tax=Polynucleobacter sp. es-MAR-4 TaxID=1855655 RepID=UPI001C0C342D|nr:hypothetical protein [Polynucleobacter sp. es-MAR-4]MBU3637569.1 hypothetical protein [Polynucleobacter sp. es-MAR-4]
MFAQLVTLLIQLICIPVFISAWGVNLYGEWLVLYSIPSLLILSDLGFTSAASNVMTMEYRKKNYYFVNEIFQSTFVLLVVFSFGILLLTPTLSSILYNNELIILNYISYVNFIKIVTIFSIYIVIIFQCNLINAYLRAKDMYHTGVYIENLTRLSEFGCIIIMLCNKLNPEYIAFGYLLGRLFGFILYLCVFLIDKSVINYGFKSFKMATINNLVKPSLAFMGFPIGNGLNNFGLTYIINILIGPSGVVVFNTVRTVTRSALQGVNIVNNAVSPQMSIAFSSNNIKLLKKLNLNCCRFSFFGSGFVGILLFFFGIYIIQYWTKANLEVDRHFFFTILFSLPFSALWLSSSVILASTNSHFLIGKMYFLLSILLLPLAYFFCIKFGIFGIGLALFLLDFFMLICVLYESLNMLNVRLYDFILQLFFIEKIKKIIL